MSNTKSTKKPNEGIIIKQGKLQFAAKLNTKSTNSPNSSQYIYMDKGEVRYEDDRWFANVSEFDVSNELHAISKSIFIDQLRVYVRTKLAEIKQLELLLNELDLPEVFSTNAPGGLLPETKVSDNGEASEDDETMSEAYMVDERAVVCE